MKTSFVSDKSGQLKPKSRPKMDFSNLDFGSVSKMRKNPRPSKSSVEDLTPNLSRPKSTKQDLTPSSIDLVEAFFDNTPGSPVRFGVGYDGQVLNAANYTIEASNPRLKFRFVSSRPGYATRAAMGGYVEAKFDETTRLSNDGKPVIIGDRRYGGSMVLMVRKSEHAEERENYKDMILKSKRNEAKNRRREELEELADRLSIPNVIDKIEEKSESFLAGQDKEPI
jgi:hypothetical protein